MVAFAGDDVVIGAGEADTILGGEGADFINAGDGRDIVFVGTGDDTDLRWCRRGLIYGEAGGDRVFGDAGDDMISGGAGDDTVFGGAGNDVIVAETGDGNDTYFGDEAGGGSGVDTLTCRRSRRPSPSTSATAGSCGVCLERQSGTTRCGALRTSSPAPGTTRSQPATQRMSSMAGPAMTRSSSRPPRLRTATRSWASRPATSIDLSGIDANAGSAGNQAFALVTGSALTGPGQLIVTHETRADGDYTVVNGNVDGDADAEFRINIAGTHNLTSTDFNL